MPTLPPVVRRHRRAFLAGLGASAVAAAGYGLTVAVERVRMSAARSKDT